MTQSNLTSKPNKIIDGNIVAAEILHDVKTMIKNHEKQPKLAVILVGQDPASDTYVNKKVATCELVGIRSHTLKLPEDISEEELIHKINELNNDDSIHGILVQLPLPKHIETTTICNTIKPSKDVDGLNAITLGNIIANSPDKVIPCTPRGILYILQYINLELTGLNCTIVGASTIVGKPLAIELVNKGTTVTICHKDTKNLAMHIKEADLLITAIGKPGVIKSEWLKNGCVAIDIGICKVANKIYGDLDFTSALENTSRITPVPGGVGPVTVAMLMLNTAETYFKHVAKLDQ